MLDNLFQQYLELLQDILNHRYPLLSEKIIENIEKEYSVLINSEKTKSVMPSNPNQKMHAVTPIVVIALNRSIKAIEKKKVTKKLISDVMNEVFVQFVGPLAEMQRKGLEIVEDK